MQFTFQAIFDMSSYNIFIDVPNYLKDWLKFEFWNDDTHRIEFERGTAERIIMELFLTKPPKGTIPKLADDHLLPVEVPTFYGKNPAQFNHLPTRATNMLVSTIKKRFKKMLWDELHVIRLEEVELTDLIYAFMEAHGIEDSEKNFLAIRQIYTRMRLAYNKRRKG